MNTEGDMKVFFILLPLFLAVGVYLLVYGRKRAAMMREFAARRGLKHLSGDDIGLTGELNGKFGLSGGRARSFSKVRDIVASDEVLLFRCVELLDLNPYRKSAATHHGRIAVTFKVPEDVDLFVSRDPDGTYRSVYPPAADLSRERLFPAIKEVVEKDPPPHVLSMTFREGRALLYLLPLVVGSEKREDLDYLFRTAERLSSTLEKAR